MKSTLLQNTLFGSGISFAAGCIAGLPQVSRRPEGPVRQALPRVADMPGNTDASGLRPVAKLPKPQLEIAWRPRYDEFWLAPLITGVLFVWVRIGLAVCGISPLL